MNINRKVIIIAVSILLALLVATSITVAVVFHVNRIGHLSGDYLYADSSSVSLFRIVNNNGQLSGTFYIAVINNNSNTVVQDNIPFTGSIIDNQVTLTFSAWFATSNIQGSYDGYRLTLIYPMNGRLANVVFSPSSIDDYNNALARLTQNAINAQSTVVSEQATQTMIAYRSDEQSRLNYDLQNIGGAIQQLKSDSDFSSQMQQYKDAIAQAQSDYQTEQSDSQAGCSNYYQVGTDDYKVGTDAYQVGTIDYQLSSQVTSINSDISNVQDYVSKIQQHWSNLGNQAYGISQSDIDNAVQNGNNAISHAQSAMSDAQNQSSSYDNSVKKIQQQADALYNGMHC